MQRVIDISLSGHAAPFRLHEDAYDLLRRYLDQARSGLTDEADRAEVVDDLERSIGEKLLARSGAEHPVLSQADVAAVLDEIGAVETDAGTSAGASAASTPSTAAVSTGRRRLMRIREGQQFAGVCTGLAEYADLRLDVVRVIFVILTIVTAGTFLLLYLLAMFVLPVVETRAEFRAAQASPHTT